MAADYGVQVHVTRMPAGMLGAWVPSKRRIYIDLALTFNERRSVIAHELGHVHYGHSCDSGPTERQADAFAAQLLVDPSDYADLERISADEHYIADELNITIDVVRDFRRFCLHDGSGVRAGGREAMV
jgi:Zn-dependent peptidase ImmA (M78 family)